ncbi:formate dehydrogenase accessory protein FdhE [Paraburkholderia tropica]|uniref:Protein FdhE homolog n=1 Tax=Paraburkholderia tropica TaxID=92647 RepID=A0A1A5XGL1_9BURK|nr:MULTISPECIES: formate dehydrogenase accessory protein FdhE [Paraburkholderia]MBB2982170.1 FdhE protein [Paraburkholderia tropica]MBB3003132.1 FdhE protein [Paraburkholderia tropica]MBB6322015.1 FdhE protein [Paraburkholderia tropica]OBR52310.1 formate dehydrogenase accessory protein FdhE [Paraburkholderia tropica]RQM45010.1 formate dehydrogenase accessory protein FdhE [Paraburkholderia bannensis]
MTQRILDPEQIQAQDPSAIPRIRLPERGTLFKERAARLRKLADHNPIGGYMRLMAALVDAQQQALDHFDARMPEREAIDHAQRHSMPILPALGGERDPQWREVLRRLADRVEAAGAVTPALANVLDSLRAMSDAQLDAQADALLAQRHAEVSPATAPFIMAALQVVWTDLASRLNTRDVPYVDAPGVCPVCGTPPVASIVRVGGALQGYRFTQCSLCATEHHVVRVKCTNCDSTKGIAYHGIEGGSDAVKAESCDECHTYRKIGYQDKDLDFEPLADDLASLTLDLLMGEAGYRRASANPLLYPEAPAEQ